LWKVIKRFKRPQTQYPPIRKQDEKWARNDEEKAEAFVRHLSKAIEPHPHEITIEEEKKLLTDTPAKMIAPVKPFTAKEKRAAIKILNPKEALGYYLITNQVLQKLPKTGIRSPNSITQYSDKASSHFNGN